VEGAEKVEVALALALAFRLDLDSGSFFFVVARGSCSCSCFCCGARTSLRCSRGSSCGSDIDQQERGSGGGCCARASNRQR
jgi:hypothetical protein